MKTNKRSKLLMFRLTEEEHKIIDDEAKRRSVSKAEVFRSLLGKLLVEKANKREL